ncbi:hypothetical protein KO481_15250 [Nocardia sp. NEAU-G5]|uniref:Tetratricopeptide repeat protein n=1 Tax=Nocardia albiluteola TaxID=2842303 RepID=A0ABS6B0S0_9NOCA|nr:hypothetical protein [Nocardia albiluteola]MBU3062875.1 hypothetical protein [Nocardia albiluteola]
MDTAEIRHALTSARTVPDGSGRTRRLEALADAARDGADRLAEAEVLLDLVRAYTYAGERDLAPSAFDRLLRVFDDNAGAVGALSHSVHWYLKWMTHNLIDNPAVSLTTVYHWLDELERRYRAAEYSMRPVLKLRSALARNLGDYETAARLREESLAAPRDTMTDCEACECHWAGTLSVAMGEDRDALERWAPVLNGRRRCAEEPHRIRAHALLPLVRAGRVGEARSAHLTGYPLVRDKPGLRYAVAQHIEFCALTGNEARGLDILAEHAGWLTDAGADADLRLEFATGAGVLLRRLVELGHGDLLVGSRTAGSVLAELLLEIDTLCNRYDTRNGTDAVSTAIRARLVAAPLLDRLPLGIKSSTSLRPVATHHADPSAEAARWAGRLGELAAARLAADPAGAEQRLRHALNVGARVLSPEQLARLSSLLVTAISVQPGRESALADAAVTAAWRWETLSEADAVHHALVAARACHRAGRHGEAAALFEQPLSLAPAEPGTDIPYPPSEIALIRRQFGESLNGLNRYPDAAAQFTEGARLVLDTPAHRELHAELEHAAAAALSLSGRDADALAAYLRAAELFDVLDRLAARARCLRAAAWLQFWGESREQGLGTMRTLLSDLVLRAEAAPAPEVDAELVQTRRQLEAMLDEERAE